MNKAFIFDMDGVIVDSERAWEKYDPHILVDLFGKEIADAIGETVGVSIEDYYEIALKMGLKLDLEKYYQIWDERGEKVYNKTVITKGVDKLALKLIEQKIKLGMVTASRRSWINFVLPRIKFADKLESIVCMPERPKLCRKPAPDGYLAAINELNSTPQNTIILEDSNTGIKAAKASGAFIIGLRENLLPNYQQKGADVYADKMTEVLDVVRKHFK